MGLGHGAMTIEDSRCMRGAEQGGSGNPSFQVPASSLAAEHFGRQMSSSVLATERLPVPSVLSACMIQGWQPPCLLVCWLPRKRPLPLSKLGSRVVALRLSCSGVDLQLVGVVA